MNQSIISKNVQETIEHAQKTAKSLKKGNIITLNGDLGMGKTTFARALIRALTDNETLDVPSPTYTLIQTYDSSLGIISHFDCYRLDDPEEIYEVGWDDALHEGIVLIEWPQRLGTIIPKTRIDIHLKDINNNPHHREIIIEKVE